MKPESRAIVEAFGRAVTREAHNLTERPELLDQQLRNRLQWESDEVRAALGAAPGSNGARPRISIRVKTEYREAQAVVRTLTGHAGPVLDCAVAPDGSYVVSAGGDGTGRIWDLDTGKPLLSIPVTRPQDPDPEASAEGGAHCCAVSPDGSLVVCGGADGTITVLDPTTGARLWSAETSSFTIKACAMSPDGTRVVTGTRATKGLFAAGIVRIWDSATGDEVATLGGGLTSVISCAVSPNGKVIALGTEYGEVGLWGGRTGRRPLRIEAHAAVMGSTEHFQLPELVPRFEEEVNDCAFSPDATFLVTAGDDSTLRLWEPRFGGSIRTVERTADFFESPSISIEAALGARGTNFTACAVSPDGEVIVSGSRSGVLTLWDAANGAEHSALEGHGDEITACVVSPNGKWLVSSSRDETLKVWDLEQARGE